MMRGEEPFIYDKKVLEEVCWQHAQICLHISAMMKCLRGHLFCTEDLTPFHRVTANLFSRVKHGMGHRCTNEKLLCLFFRFVL
jgi:hypothetical protein